MVSRNGSWKAGEASLDGEKLDEHKAIRRQATDTLQDQAVDVPVAVPHMRDRQTDSQSHPREINNSKAFHAARRAKVDASAFGNRPDQADGAPKPRS